MKLIRRPFRYTYSNAVLFLIGINILVYIIMMVTRSLFLFSILPMRPLDIIYRGRIWQFFTYMFVHSPYNIRHVLFNMFALFIFGSRVEREMGSREFLLYYFITGTLAGIFSFAIYVFTGELGVSLMGASGAVFAVQLAYAAYFPRSIIYIWGIIPIRAPILVLGFAALEVIFLVTGREGNVAHMTHLAGFAFGWLYFLLRFRIDPLKAMRG